MDNKKSKIKDAPSKIYLTTGLSETEAQGTNFNELADVTWCERRIFDGDIEYRRVGTKVEKPVDWQQVRINAAVAVIGHFEHHFLGASKAYQRSIAKSAVGLADALVEELMKKGAGK